MILAHLPVVVTFVVVAEKQKETFSMKQHFVYFAKCLLNVPTYECYVIIGWLHSNRIFQMVSEYPACSRKELH